MAYPYDAADLAAISRLGSYYNGSVYDAGSNPGGFGQGGHRVNFLPSLVDTALIANAVSDAADYADTAATAAAASETAAAASAANLTGTSTSSVAIGTGSKAFTTQSGKSFAAGTPLIIYSAANPSTNFMGGISTAYSGTSLTVNVSGTGGSGTYTDWTIAVAGLPGAAGAAGATGATGPTTGLEFAFSNGTTDSDPGNGIFKLSSGTFASITTVYLDNLDRFSNDISAILDSWDDSGKTTDRGILAVAQISDPSKRMVFVVTGSVVDGTGYRKVSVTPVGTGTIPTNGENCTLNLTRTGAPGADGVGAGTVIGDTVPSTANHLILYADTSGQHIATAGGGVGTSGHNLGWLDGNNTQSGNCVYSGTSSFTNTVTVTSASASALTVGRLGATTPALQIDASTASCVTGLQIKANSLAAAAGTLITTISSGTNEALSINAKGTGGLLLQGTATGIVRVGAAAPLSTTGFSVNRYTSGFYTASVTNPNATAGDLVMAVAGGSNAADITTILVVFYDAGINTLQGQIRRNGSGAVAYVTTSDGRMKNGVETLPGTRAKEIIDGLRPVSYRMLVDEQTSYGFIAQEAAKVTHWGVHPGDGNAKLRNGDEGFSPWGMDQSAYVPFLVADAQETHREIARLQKELADLKKRLN